MATDLSGLLDDLRAESAELDDILVPITPEQWRWATPASTPPRP